LHPPSARTAAGENCRPLIESHRGPGLVQKCGREKAPCPNTAQTVLLKAGLTRQMWSRQTDEFTLHQVKASRGIRGGKALARLLLPLATSSEEWLQRAPLRHCRLTIRDQAPIQGPGHSMSRSITHH